MNTTDLPGLLRLAAAVVALALVAASCAAADEEEQSSPPSTASEVGGQELAATAPEPSFFFETLPPGSELPDGALCAERVMVDASIEVRPENEEPNGLTAAELTAPEPVPTVDIDGAEEVWNAALSPRVVGDFTGTTEQILRWASCKWGFNEDVTKARAVTESTWFANTEGDTTDEIEACAILGFDAPCAQSYGLLQVKGSVHLGTYPLSARSSAYGADYAMAWLRACYEGSFTWLDLFAAGEPYQAGNEFGCVGAWFSGEWWDQPANDYVGTVRYHLQNRTWEEY